MLIISESNVTLNSQLFILDHKNSQIFLIFWKKKKNNLQLMTLIRIYILTRALYLNWLNEDFQEKI